MRTNGEPSIGISFSLVLIVCASSMGAVLIGSDVRVDVLFEIDPATASLTSIGALDDPVVASLTYDSNHSILYGSSALNNTLLTIDPSTGDVSVVGPLGVDLMQAIEYNSNTDILYGIDVDTDELYTIDVVTGLATSVGMAGFTDVNEFGGVGGMAYDPLNDVMYATDAGPFGSSGLFTVSLGTGEITLVGEFNNNLVAQMTGLAFDPTLGLYGADNGHSSGVPDRLFRIDASTGHATHVGDMGDNANFLGLTFIPEPSTGLGLMFLAAYTWRRGTKRKSKSHLLSWIDQRPRYRLPV